MGVLVAVRWLVLALCFLSVQGRRTTVRGCKCKMDYRIWNGKRYTGGSCVPGKNGGKAWCETEPWTCKTRLPKGTTADVCAGKAPAKKPAPSKKKVVKTKKSKPAPPPKKKQPSSSRRGANRRTGNGQCADPGEWRSTIMNLHNNLRDKHGAEDVCWDYGLESQAQSWANGCQWRHSGNGNGENIAIADSWGTTFGMWAAEANGFPYGASTAPFSQMHFSQLVWKGTRRVGCAMASCGMGQFYVCQYSPPGNYMGQFAENVSGPRY